MIIDTDRLVLRPFKEADAGDVYEYLHEPDQDCFLDMKLTSLEETKEELLKRTEDPLYLAIELRETGKVIGELFSGPEELGQEGENSDTFSPCWMLNPDYQHKGYGFEAAFAYLNYLFEQMNARRVYMYTEETNVACQKLCEKLGARKEGLFLEFISFVTDANGHPIYVNTLQYAILRKEWEARQSRKV